MNWEFMNIEFQQFKYSKNLQHSSLKDVKLLLLNRSLKFPFKKNL